MPEGSIVDLSDAQSAPDDATNDSEQTHSLSKMIDWTVALLPTFEKSQAIANKSRGQHLLRNSLNQTRAFPKTLPLFIDIEMKKTLQNRDPCVQLAIWAQAGYKKRKMHGWDRTFPMPGITVDGHVWTCFLFFEVADDEMVCFSFSSCLALQSTDTL